MEELQTFITTVTAKRSPFDFHIRETLRYRDLIGLFVKRDFVTNYKQTLLGPLWALIQPILTTVVFTVVFGNLAGLTTADTAEKVLIPSFLFYLCGNTCWSYFSSVVNATSGTFLNNRATMSKVYYPRLVAPISTALSKLIPFAIQFLLLIGFWLYYLIKGGTSICVSATLFLLPLCVLQMMLLAVGCGMVISSLTTKYRDMQMLVGFGLSLWQFASPIAYGMGLIPQKYLWLYMLNPITPVITTFRYALFGFGYFNIVYYAISWGISLAVIFVGLLLFSRVERTFADTI